MGELTDEFDKLEALKDEFDYFDESKGASKKLMG